MKNLLRFGCLLLMILVTPSLRAQGVLWGFTEKGGLNGDGTIYRINTDGTNQVVHKSFWTSLTGIVPMSRMALHPNGKFYGTTSEGGELNAGVIFEFDPATGVYAKRYDFNSSSGYRSFGGLTLASNGRFYGTAFSGPSVSQYGTLFEFDPATNAVTVKYIFTGGTEGAYPDAVLTKAGNGKLYGAIRLGGINNKGILFEYDPATSVYTKKQEFGALGWNLSEGSSELILGTNGLLYGLAVEMSTGTYVLFEYNSATNSLSTKVLSNNNLLPRLAMPGKLYGFTSAGLGAGIGEIDLATSTISLRFAFTDQVLHGAGHQGLTAASNGKFYGVASGGGQYEVLSGSGIRGGILFEFDPGTNGFTKKVDFQNDALHSSPKSQLVMAPDGMLYGVNSDSWRTYPAGAIFKFNAQNGTVTRSFEFSHFSNGRGPSGAFVKATNGLLYGITLTGGTNNTGNVIAVDPNYDMFTHPGYSAEATFAHPNLTNSIGSYPQGGLLWATNRFYGVTSRGGGNGYGTIFEHYPGTAMANGTGYTGQLYSFTFDHSVSGAQCGLSKTTAGAIFGMTSIGGTNNIGTIYQYSSGTITIRHNFSSATTGSTPLASLFQASNGKMYGVTSLGGVNGVGALFEFDPVTYTVTKRHDFAVASTGSIPKGNLIQASNGLVYGLTSAGGANGAGTLFEFNTSTNVLTKRADFSSTLGTGPKGTLFQSSNGKLYGVAYSGGSANMGTLFEFDPTTNAISKKLDFTGVNGANPNGSFLYDAFVPKAPQTITLTGVSNKTFGDAPFTVSAVASSGLPVALSVSPASVATISGSTITITGAGTAYIYATQAGDANYFAAIPVQSSFDVSKIVPTITFTSGTTVPYNSQLSLTVNKGGSTGAVSYTRVNGTGSASLSGNTLTGTLPGTVTVTASVAEDANYLPGTANQVVTVSKLNPAIAITSASSGTYGGTVGLTVNKGGSTGTATWSVTNGTGTANITGGTTLNLTGAGTVTVTVNVAADSYYNAGSANQAFTINKANQTITFNTLSNLCEGSNKILVATSTSGLVVSFTSSSTGIVSISGTTATGVSAGTSTITASQAGNGNYNAATSVNRSQYVVSSTGTITQGNSICDGPVELTAGSGHSYSWGNQNYMAYLPGEYSVSYTTWDGCSVSSTTYVDECHGGCTYCPRKAFTEADTKDPVVEGDKYEGTFVLYPNPTKGDFVIHLDRPTVSPGSVKILDLNGIERHFQAVGHGVVEIRVKADLNPGTFVVDFSDETSTVRKKIVVIK